MRATPHRAAVTLLQVGLPVGRTTRFLNQVVRLELHKRPRTDKLPHSSHFQLKPLAVPSCRRSNPYFGFSCQLNASSIQAPKAGNLSTRTNQTFRNPQLANASSTPKIHSRRLGLQKIHAPDCGGSRIGRTGSQNTRGTVAGAARPKHAHDCEIWRKLQTA